MLMKDRLGQRIAADHRSYGIEVRPVIEVVEHMPTAPSSRVEHNIDWHVPIDSCRCGGRAIGTSPKPLVDPDVVHDSLH